MDASSDALGSPYWVRLLSPCQRRRMILSLLPWLFLLIVFCVWWTLPIHHISILGSGIATALILFEVLMPGYFYYFLLRSRVVNPLIEPNPSWRLAMVVTSPLRTVAAGSSHHRGNARPGPGP